MYLLANLVSLIFTVLNWLIIIRVIVSWLRPTFRDPRVYKALRLVHDLTEPILEPIRRFMPTGMGLDLSPLVVLFLLSVLRGIVLDLIL